MEAPSDRFARRAKVAGVAKGSVEMPFVNAVALATQSNQNANGSPPQEQRLGQAPGCVMRGGPAVDGPPPPSLSPESEALTSQAMLEENVGDCSRLEPGLE